MMLIWPASPVAAEEPVPEDEAGDEEESSAWYTDHERITNTPSRWWRRHVDCTRVGRQKTRQWMALRGAAATSKWGSRTCAAIVRAQRWWYAPEGWRDGGAPRDGLREVLREGVREGVREDADHVVEATFHRNLQQEEGGGSKRRTPQSLGDATPASPRSHPISGNAMEVGGSEPLSAPRVMTRPLGAVDPFYLKAQYSLLSPRPKGSASPTWVRPHVGPTNDRLVISLGLSGTSGVTLRVGNRTRGWPEDDKALVFDDSFEHEVTHTGEATRAVLIVHFAHPMAMPAGTNGAAVVRLGEGVCDRETEGEMELLRAAVGPLG